MCDKQTVQSDEVTVSKQNAVKDDSKSEAEVQELHTAAVQTRAQKQAYAIAAKPLKIKEVEALNVTCEEFKQMQREDVNLSKYWKVAKEQKDDGAKAKFVVQDEILYRIYKAAPNMDPVEQVCVAAVLINKVIELGHEALLSGHQGIARTCLLYTSPSPRD